jgi:hypothetical protein
MPDNSDKLVYFDPRDKRIHVLFRWDNGMEVETAQTVDQAELFVTALQKAIGDAKS